ncbi:hypothetical protein [Streptomyces platensis]|uniref:hypothetical protein n=1 Tax=Streptomyces platensis TaxID=58346 RepID=UPI003862E304|nr:hypothetical protein OG962_12870 [Streptomyces platensis]
MGTFLMAAAGFPTLVFTAALGVVVAFWLLVAVGVTTPDAFDSDADLDAWGMGGVPVVVAFSLLTAVAWLVSLAGTLLLDPVVAPGMGRALVRVAVLAAALLGAWRVTGVLVGPLRRLFPDEPGPPRANFTGLTRTLRTGQVDADLRRAEVADQDGSAIRVRQAGAEPLTYGVPGLLYAYDDTGEHFRAAPYVAALAPRGHAA